MLEVVGIGLANIGQRVRMGTERKENVQNDKKGRQNCGAYAVNGREKERKESRRRGRRGRRAEGEEGEEAEEGEEREEEWKS